jgi:hypothetical protein
MINSATTHLFTFHSYRSAVKTNVPGVAGCILIVMKVALPFFFAFYSSMMMSHAASQMQTSQIAGETANSFASQILEDVKAMR